MKIFGKRPFVLKTAEMGGKLNNIPAQIQAQFLEQINLNKTLKSGLTQNVADANTIITNVKKWLSLVEFQAGLYKDAQTEASAIRKTLSKKHLSNDDTFALKIALKTLGSTTAEDNSNPTIQNTIHIIDEKMYPKIPEAFAHPTQWKPILQNETTNPESYKALIAEAKNLEEGCRKTKQELKNKFEEVYKQLSTFVKQVQKHYDDLEKAKNDTKKQTKCIKSIASLVQNAKHDFKDYKITYSDE